MWFAGGSLNPPTSPAPRNGVILLVAAPALNGIGFAEAELASAASDELAAIATARIRIVQETLKGRRSRWTPSASQVEAEPILMNTPQARA